MIYIIGGTVSLAVLLVSIFTVIVVLRYRNSHESILLLEHCFLAITIQGLFNHFRRRQKKPRSPKGPQEPAVYYNDVTDRVDEGVVDPAYQTLHEGAYTELQTHEYAKLQVNKQEEVQKDDNKQYENTEVQSEIDNNKHYESAEVKFEDDTAENDNKQHENNQYELTKQYENVALN